MTIIATTIPDTTAGKIKRNAEIALKSASSYVVVVASAAAAVWLGLSEAQQAAFIASHPVLAPLSPYLAVLAWLAAKLAPQNIVLSADKEAERAALIAKIQQLEEALGIVPAPVVAPPAPSQTAIVGAQLAAVLQPHDALAAVRPLFPGKTDAEIRAAIALVPSISAGSVVLPS